MPTHVHVSALTAVSIFLMMLVMVAVWRMAQIGLARSPRTEKLSSAMSFFF